MPHSRRHSSKSTPRKTHNFPKSSRENLRRAVMLATVAATAALPHKRAHAAPAFRTPPSTQNLQRATAPFSDVSKIVSTKTVGTDITVPQVAAPKLVSPKTGPTLEVKTVSKKLPVLARSRGPQVSTAATLDVPSAIAEASLSAPLSKSRPLKKIVLRARVSKPDVLLAFGGKSVFAVAPVATAQPVVATVKPDADRVLLAQLDEELQRTQAKLKASDEKLSEGQRQLLGLSGTLKNVMQDAGDEAGGLNPFVRVASRYAGTPYVWGGESRYGFDCSGFIIRVMRDLGYRALPHSAAEQFTYGEPVSQAFLKPGDLVFFANTYKPGISHVGIYIGKRHFIHAASTRQGTIISSLDTQPYSRKYAGARRLISMKRA